MAKDRPADEITGGHFDFMTENGSRLPAGDRMPLQPYFDHAGITLYNGDCRQIFHQLKTEAFDT